jgi:hypothetical protein
MVRPVIMNKIRNQLVREVYSAGVFATSLAFISMMVGASLAAFLFVVFL